MAAFRCAGAGRALLRRAPGILRRAADVGEQGVLQRRIAPMSCFSSNSYYYNLDEFEKKNLAVDLMKERSAYREIQNVEQMLVLINSAQDKLRTRLSFGDEPVSDSCRQQEAARRAMDEKKLELVSLLLRPDDGKGEYKKKIDEFALAARRHQDLLHVEDLKAKNELHAKILIGIMLWGVPLTLAVLTKLQ
ncbi:unnamed protein product [Alopecurus aequalis]